MERKVFLFNTIEKKTDSSPLHKERLKMNLDSEFNLATAHSTDGAASPHKRTKQRKKACIVALLQCHMPAAKGGVDILTVTCVYSQTQFCFVFLGLNS